MRRIAVILAVIGVLLFGVGRWLSDQHRSKPALAPVTTPDNSDYYMDNATVYQLSKQGKLAYRMKVARTLHFPNGSARLKDIHVHYLQGTQTYWNLHAAKGRVPAGQRELYLYDGVVIHHPRETHGTAKVTTPHAWIRPDANRIDSNARVTAVEPGRRITGDGMKINLNTNTLNLLDNVHVTYTP